MKYIITLFIGLWSHCAFAQSWEYVGSPGFSAGKPVYNTSMVFDKNGIPFIAFQDAGNNNAATVMKFNGINWVTVGNAGFSEPNIGLISLAINKAGIPYVLYSSSPNGNATVMKLSGNTWIAVGNIQFSGSSAFSPSIAIDNNNVPYVAYEDYDNSDKATVMKFNGTDWVAVGKVGFTPNAVQTISLAFDKSNTPYIGFQDGAGGRASVMKFTGSAWVYVGNQWFSSTVARYVSFVIDKNDELYVGFASGDVGLSIPTLMKFNGTSWIYVGGYFDGANYDFDPTLAVDNNGIPYFAFMDDNTENNSASVIQFDGNSWVPVGDAGFSKGFIGYSQDVDRSSLSIAINDAGIPYVAYADYFNNANGKLSVMRFSQSPAEVQLCPSTTSTTLTAGIIGTAFQWQVNTGSGFQNIADGNNYNGATTASLQLNNISTNWYGYQYKCIVDGKNSDVFILKFSDKWIGSINSAWENTQNWGCGIIPDSNTDVIINGGNVVLSTNAIIRSITIKSGATVTLDPAVKLTILH
ncbi:NHL repeat-containing protein [Ferruginibacter albus]|uniref:hypothetical protein n=1 Tax=Ferruginibacter albus TaxID=2875540 RepID=UPI001CC42709|nr:hypothetical protein [Ferruginibacter albus]UAY52645.1 hypothetical protein K9M53_02880 [Ferruginibacter albus]